MSVKLKYSDLINLNSGLDKISKLSQEKDSKVNFRLSVMVATLIKKFSDIMEAYNTEREKLLKKYTSPVYTQSKTKFHEDGSPQMENTGNVNFENQKNQDDFIKEHNKLLDTEIEFESLFKFKMKDLEKLSSVGFGVPEVSSLMPLIEDIETYKWKDEEEEGGES